MRTGPGLWHARGMSLGTVLSHLAPLARSLRKGRVAEGGDPSLLFNAVVEAGYLVAAADGTVDSAELATLKRAILTLTGDDLPPEELDTLVEDLIDLRKTEGEAARCRAVGELLAAHKAGDEGLYLAAAIAYASNGLDRSELAVLERIASAAGVSQAALVTLATQVRNDLGRRSIPG
jgi:tellurite resistance protein